MLQTFIFQIRISTFFNAKEVQSLYGHYSKFERIVFQLLKCLKKNNSSY